MDEHGIVGTLALTLQVAVAGYALWLNRSFGTRWAAWALCIAFLLMAFMHLNEAWEPAVTVSAFGLQPQLAYMFISLLLLLGLSHLGTVLRERQNAQILIRQARDQLEVRVNERTAELVRTNEQLGKEIEQRKQAEAEIRASQEQLRQMQKMEAIGLLAGGVAHDFNNVLTVIEGYSQLLLSADSIEANARDWVKQISQAADRAGQLTQQLLAFSRKQEIKTETKDINTIIGNISKMLRAMLGETVSVDLDLSPQLPPVQADEGQLGQVLMNLAVNARDAMPSGGCVRIQSELITFGPASTSNDPEVRPGEFVCLSFSDTGSGIPPEILPRIFEPFFTTKDVGKGTGLGLATVYGIIKQHQGWVRVSSELNKGTTFRLFLPAATAAFTEREIVPETTHQSQKGTILVVEDEPALLDMVTSILESHEYRVLSASSGPAAIERWHEQQKTVDLLLTDVVMPGGFSGAELLRRLRQDRPELRGILMSGYVAPEISLSDHDVFVQKPYRPSTLLKAIHDCLRQSAEPPADSAVPLNALASRRRLNRGQKTAVSPESEARFQECC